MVTVTRAPPARAHRTASDLTRARRRAGSARSRRGTPRDRLVEQHGAVGDREPGHEVGHERQPAAAEQAQDAEEQELSEEGREEDQGEEPGERGRVPGICVGGSAIANGQQHDRCRRASTPQREPGPACACTRSWPYTPPPAYESEDRTTASVPAIAHRSPAGWKPVMTATPTSPSASAGDPDGAERLVREVAQAEEDDEDRHRRLRDPRDARVDVGLSPGDERHRQRCVDRLRARGRAARRSRSSASAARRSRSARRCTP